MSLTRDELVERVRRMLYDFATPASATMTGDNVTNIWILPDRYIDPTRLDVYLTAGGVTNKVTGITSIYGFDADTSAITFTTAPSDVTVANATYWYHHWATDDIVWGLTDAVNQLAPTLYVQDTLDVTVDGSGTYELDTLTDEPVMAVREVKHSYDEETWERLPKRTYRIERDTLDAASISLPSDPGSGTLRVFYARRPLPFADGTETISDLGLPERVARALVLYACWTLLEQRIIPRMRSDIAVVTQGEGVPSPFMLLQHSARIKMLLDMELDRQKMRPTTAIGI